MDKIGILGWVFVCLLPIGYFSLELLIILL